MTRAKELEARLERLESQNRRLRLFLYAGLVAVGGAVVMAQSRPAQTLEAERFVVRNADGDVRAVLGLNDDGAPHLAIYEPGQEIESVWLGLLDAVPLFTLNRVGETFQSQLTEGLFFVRGSNGSILVDLETTTAGGGMALRDASGQARARINWPGQEASLALYTPAGEARVVAGIDSRGTASIGLPFGGATGAQMYARGESLGIRINDPQGRLRYGVDVPSAGAANMGIFDEEGKTLFGVP